MGDESNDVDCDEVICTGWGEPGGEWTERGWQNEQGSWRRLIMINFLWWAIGDEIIYTIYLAVWGNTSVWQTDGRTDSSRTDAIAATACSYRTDCSESDDVIIIIIIIKQENDYSDVRQL